jgi:hypothetical protein
MPVLSSFWRLLTVFVRSIAPAGFSFRWGGERRQEWQLLILFPKSELVSPGEVERN